MRVNFYGWNLPAILGLGLLLAGCASAPGPQSGDIRPSRYQVGRPSYQVGKPYQVKGVWYSPKVDYSYDETGTGSWYGEQFNHQPTSNGEIFDLTQVSAAHKTLPLPSVVEVTNLQNGRSLRVRVNDRGPFVDGRIIDLSRRAAQLLGYELVGTAPVRVRVLKDESIQVAQAAMRGETGQTMVAEAMQGPRASSSGHVPVTAPVVRMAAAAPLPPAPLPVPPPAPPPISPPAIVERAAPVPLPPPVAAPPPIAATPEPMPPRQVAAAPAQHRSWSLISQARADTLHPPPSAPMPPPMKPIPAVAHGSNRFFIQAGAFAVPENAQRARARIASLGSVEVLPATGNGSSLYRVRLGPVASEAEAHRLVTRLSESGYPGARVVGE